MNNLKSVEGSSSSPSSHHQTKASTPIPSNSIPINIIESSVCNLIKTWSRRETWLHLMLNGSKSSQQDLINKAPWRYHLVNFLESTWIHVLAFTLLILDLVITIYELSSSLLPCSHSNGNTDDISWYHWVGIGILSLLCAKVVGLAVGLGSSFFRRPGHVVDGVVVVGALVLESFVERKGGGLVVVVSLWRVVRVVESAFELSDEAIEAQIASIVGQFEALREENERLLETIADRDETIEKLKEDLDQCGHV